MDLQSLCLLPEKTSFNLDFYIKNVLPVAQRDGMKLIGKDFVYQQDCATSHTSQETISAIKNMDIELIFDLMYGL